MPVTVQWLRERFTFELPPPETPLSAIRSALSEATHLDPNGFKLIHAGAVMNDDNAPISAYRLKPNSKIVLIPKSGPDEPQHPSAPISTTTSSITETSVLSTISAEMHTIRSTLLPDLDRYLSDPSNQKEHLRLGELLLQALLRLDAISTEPTWETARRERKSAVKEVQALLDRLDSVRS